MPVASSNLSPAFSLLTYSHKKNGETEKRVHISDPHNLLLTQQVEIWKPATPLSECLRTNKNLEAKKVGIRVHGKVVALLFRILQFITFNQVKKCFTATLGDKIIYVNTSSYLMWRKLNGEALSVLQPHKKITNSPRSCYWAEELNALHQMLLTPLGERPQFAPTIASATTPFQAASLALTRAQATLKRMKADPSLKFQLAAFYLLLPSKLGSDCGGEFLEINPSLLARDHHISIEKWEELNNKPVEELTPKEKKLMHRTRLLFDPKKDKRKISYIRQDLFTSAMKAAKPVEAKKILIEATKKNPKFFVNYFKYAFNCGNVDNNHEFAAFHAHIIKMGKALAQFHDKDPSLGIRASFALVLPKVIEFLKEKNLISENSIYTRPGLPTSILAALHILEKATVSNLKEGYLVESAVTDEVNLSLIIPEYDPLVDAEQAQAFSSKPLSPLSGRLVGEPLKFDKAPYLEAVEVVRALKHDLFEEEKFLLKKLVEAFALTPLIDRSSNEEKIAHALTHEPQAPVTHIERTPGEAAREEPSLVAKLAQAFGWKHAAKRTHGERNQEPALPKNLKDSFLEIKKKRLEALGIGAPAEWDESTFQQILKLAKKIVQIGHVLHVRFWQPEGQSLCNSVVFDDEGNLASFKPPSVPGGKVKRSSQNHADSLTKYFGITLPQTTRQSEPALDKNNQNDNALIRSSNSSALVNALFYIPHSYGSAGSCCVGALAQALFGTYNGQRNRFEGEDPSRNNALIAKIREGVARYIKEHPEEFLDLLTEGNDFHQGASHEEKLRALDSLCYSIVHTNKWFTDLELKAFSSIVGRPIHAIRDQIDFDKQKGTIKMLKINDFFDEAPIYLYQQGSHIDQMIPKRVGFENIP